MSIRNKWRPPLSMLVAGLVAMVLVLPTLAMGVVVLVSREPGQIIASLLENWPKIAIALGLVVLAATLTGYIFWRGLAGPLGTLATHAQAATQGAAGFRDDNSYGTREVAQLASDFEVVVDRLQTRSRYLETLSAHLVHELKSPLTSIRGAAELMRDEEKDMSEGQRVHFLDNIINDVTHLSRLSSRLRDLAQADMSEGGGSVAIGDVCDDAAKEYPKFRIVLNTRRDLLLPISGEDASIIVHHLAENAQRHGATSLQLDLQANGDLLISNNGSAIPDEIRNDLFTPFFTTCRKFGGTGLGLAIVQALVTAHGGTIDVVNCYPVTFRLNFSSLVQA
jgi:two-component system OmpR family sensor kinase